MNVILTMPSGRNKGYIQVTKTIIIPWWSDVLATLQKVYYITTVCQHELHRLS